MLIKKSIVTVNDERIKKVNINVDPDKDIITVNGQTVIHEEYVYFMLNKPNGYLSATEDRVDPVVVDLIEGYEHYDLFPVGRLDKDTEGLLIITNDGLINHKLTSPNYEVPKTYFAEIAGVVTEKDVEQFNEGIVLDDGYLTKPGKLKIINSNDISEIELTITEGKFHQVKRMFKSIGKEVIYLKRIRSNYEVPKTYFAEIAGVVTEKDVEQFNEGIVLDDGYLTKPGKLKIINSNDISEIELTITEGKFHQVKRMFKSIGKEVIYLKRIKMGEVRLDETLELSEFRKLNEHEMSYLNTL